MRRSVQAWLTGFATAAAVGLLAGQGITIPNTFSNNTVADANQVNANFSALASNACNRNGCVMTAPVEFPDGSVTAPAGTNTGDTNTGFYFPAADTFAITTAGVQGLLVDATQFIDSPTQPRAVAYHNTTQSISSATPTVLNFNSEDVDVGTMHDNATNNSRVTIPTGGDGYYCASGQVSWASAAGNYRQAQLRKNGGAALTDNVQTPVSAGSTAQNTGQWCGTLVATDYVELVGAQDSGGAINAGNATRSDSNALTVTKLW